MDNKKQLASRFINSTGRHIFLTGKAGTGKTTFLKDIVEQTHKKAVVAAPTGIAAINAGGVTLHSLFQLPFGSFIPSDNSLAQMTITTEVHTPRSLIRGTKFFEAKRKLLRELELLIIDEVSMLRADLLDAIDNILRHVRRKRGIPFGGLQILFIGDLQQLPPVIKNDEWDILQRHYQSMFFFQAKALQNNPPLTIELDHIYRQSDPRFIAILNKLRDNKIGADDTASLNRYVKPSFNPLNAEGYIFITTHNHKADCINNEAIQKINKPEYVYDAMVEGDFGEKLYPVDFSLRLKEGAQVMFVKNDYSGEGRYHNGKIGVVESLSDNHIKVRFNDGSPPANVDRYTWENKKYSLNPDNNEIEENRTGIYSHFPLKLAWAITVHKSQGLTFEKAVIDVSSAFAPGQIYVALSRLTGLGGLVLSETLPGRPPGQDPQLKAFYEGKPSTDVLKESLKADSQKYVGQELLRTFDFSDLGDSVKWHIKGYNKEKCRSAKQDFRPWALALHADLMTMKTVADRFLTQLMQMLRKEDNAALQKRVNKATVYFKPQLQNFSKRIMDHIVAVNILKGMKAYIRELRELESIFFGRIQMLHKSEALIKALLENTEPTKATTGNPALQQEREAMMGEEVKHILEKGRKKQARQRKSKSVEDKQEKKDTSAEISYQLYKEGISIEEIVKLRGLAFSTIMSHMATNVENGLLDVSLFLEKEKMEQILAASKAVDSKKLTDIMAVLGDEFTYTDVRMALAASGEV